MEHHHERDHPHRNCQRVRLASGEAVIHCGLLREAEANALRTFERLRQGPSCSEGTNDDAGDLAEQPKAASLSDWLAQRLDAGRIHDAQAVKEVTEESKPAEADDEAHGLLAA